VREQACFLEYIAQRTLVYRYKVLTLAVLPDFVVDLDIGLAGPFQPGDTAQAGGLARAGMTVERGDALCLAVAGRGPGQNRIVMLQAKVDHATSSSAPAGLVLRLE
jgi:hypothetical protein